MDLVEIVTPFYTDLAVQNCTGLLSILCGVRVIQYETVLADWDFTLDECIADCNLDFDLFGYSIDTDNYLLSVAFSSASIGNLTPVPLPASVWMLLIGIAGLWRLRAPA